MELTVLRAATGYGGNRVRKHVNKKVSGFPLTFCEACHRKNISGLQGRRGAWEWGERTPGSSLCKIPLSRQAAVRAEEQKCELCRGRSGVPSREDATGAGAEAATGTRSAKGAAMCSKHLTSRPAVFSAAAPPLLPTSPSPRRNPASWLGRPS